MTECEATFDGEHDYGPRWRMTDIIAGTHHSVLACVCGATPKDVEAVKAQLAETAAERQRQRELSKSMLAKQGPDERQGKLL